MSFLPADDLGTSYATTDERSHGRVPDGTDTHPSHGVKDNLSELTGTLSRQFWGVASFLAPPPPPPPPPPRSRRPDPAEIRAAGGIHSDLDEIAGSLRSGISRFSSNAAVSELSNVATNFLPFRSEKGEEREEEEEEEEDEDEDEEEEDEDEWTYNIRAFGVTDEVMAFVTNISMHPETWLDFPLFYEFEDCDDFHMSDAQGEHTWVVEHLAPRLAALRMELCPTHMTEGCFWKIYFILLHSRLSKHDADHLSTPQLVEARAMLSHRLQNRTKTEREVATKEASYRNMDDRSFIPADDRIFHSLYETTSSSRHANEEATITFPSTDVEREQHSFSTTNKSADEETPHIQPKDEPGDASRVPIQDFDEDDDAWLEDSGEMGDHGAATFSDVSFSDLEDSDNDISIPVRSILLVPRMDSQTEDKVGLQPDKNLIDPGNTAGSATSKTERSIDQLKCDDLGDV